MPKNLANFNNKKCLKNRFQASIFMIIFGDYLLARAALTVKLFLPLALLAASTLLPLGVDILSRKPCLFLFFLSDG